MTKAMSPEFLPLVLAKFCCGWMAKRARTRVQPAICGLAKSPYMRRAEASPKVAISLKSASAMRAEAFSASIRTARRGALSSAMADFLFPAPPVCGGRTLQLTHRIVVIHRLFLQPAHKSRRAGRGRPVAGLDDVIGEADRLGPIGEGRDQTA